jgi:hypothetical protein
MPKNGFYFYAIIRQLQFDEDNLDVNDNLEEYKTANDDDIRHQKNELLKAREKDCGVVTVFGGMALGDVSSIPGVQLKNPKGIRDLEEWYISIAARKGFVREIYERQTEIALINLKKYHEAVGDSLDVLYICGADFGTQTGTFFSEDTFRELYMPSYKKMNDWIHTNTKWKTMKHSCGAVSGFIPLFIEAGFDILNPVQCSCPGMEPDSLKKEYGRDIVFWGGGADTQYTLPFGTPAEIKTQVLERLKIFSKSGGYVFNAIHNVQGDTPIENIIAMIDAVKEFNG